MNKTENPYDAWRAKFLQQIILVSLILGTFAMFFGLSTNLENGKYILLFVEFFGFVSISFAAFYKKMSFSLRSGIYLAIFYITGTSLIAAYGMGNSTGFVILMGYCCLAFLLLGEKVGRYSLLHLFMTFVVMLFLIKKGFLANNPGVSISFGISVIIAINSFVFICLITYVISKMVNKLRESLMETYESQQILKCKNAELNIKNELLDQFIYRSAHDMRGPLSSILGLVNITTYDIHDSHSVSDNLSRIVGNVNRLENYLSNILDFSKSNQFDKKFDLINFHRLINEVFDNFRDVPDHDFIIDGDAVFKQDANRLTVILNNLISNSVKYRDPLKEKLVIEVKCELYDGSALIEISDNGVGIAPDRLAHIFNLFYRGDERSDGSGLGLYLVKTSVNRLGGKIEVESQVDTGTKFKIKIPVKKYRPLASNPVLL